MIVLLLYRFFQELVKHCGFCESIGAIDMVVIEQALCSECLFLQRACSIVFFLTRAFKQHYNEEKIKKITPHGEFHYQ